MKNREKDYEDSDGSEDQRNRNKRKSGKQTVNSKMWSKKLYYSLFDEEDEYEQYYREKSRRDDAPSYEK